MSTAGTYRYAQDIDVLSMLERGLGDGHDIRVVTMLQGLGAEALYHFAGARKMMLHADGLNVVDHFAGVGKMVGMNDSLR